MRNLVPRPTVIHHNNLQQSATICNNLQQSATICNNLPSWSLTECYTNVYNYDSLLCRATTAVWGPRARLEAPAPRGRVVSLGIPASKASQVLACTHVIRDNALHMCSIYVQSLQMYVVCVCIHICASEHPGVSRHGTWQVLA